MNYRTAVALGVVLVALVGCSSNDDEETSCGNISGNWKVRSTRTDGTCSTTDFGDADSTVTIRQADDGSWLAILPGVEGGCPGELNTKTCKFISNCELRTKTGAIAATAGIEWTFDGNKFSGSEITSASPPLVQTACTANYTDTGTKL